MEDNTKRRAPKHRWEDSNRYTARHFRPYALVIGQAALAWNHLHETLGQLFADIPFNGQLVANAVWQSSVVDRAKRNMLEAAIKEMVPPHIDETSKEAVLWLLKQVEALEDARNNVIHVPLTSYDHPLWQELVSPDLKGVLPDDTYLHVRAKRMRAKDVLSEYRYCRDSAMALEKYASDILMWSNKEPFPQRPRLPNRGQKKRPPNPPHQPSLI